MGTGRNLFADLSQVQRQHVGVGVWQDERGGGLAGRTDGTKDGAICSGNLWGRAAAFPCGPRCASKCLAGRHAPRPGTRSRWACPELHRGGRHRPCRRGFFERLLGVRGGSGMLRAHRQTHEAERLQLLANRALVNRHAEPLLDRSAQIRLAPAYHAVRLRPRLDKGRQFPKLCLVQATRWTGIAPVHKASQTLGIVAMNPVAKGLPVHAATTRRRRAVDPLQNQCQSQHPPRCPPIRRLARRRPQIHGAQLKPRNLDPRHCSFPPSPKQKRVRMSSIRKFRKSRK